MVKSAKDIASSWSWWVRISKCSDSSLSLTICREKKCDYYCCWHCNGTPPPNSPHPSLTWLYNLIEYLLQTICNGNWLWTARPCQAGSRAAVVADWLMERAGNGSGSRARVVAGGRVVGVAIVTRYKGRGERAESVVTPVAARRRDLNRVKRRPPPARRVCPASIQMKNPNRVVFHALILSPEKQIHLWSWEENYLELLVMLYCDQGESKLWFWRNRFQRRESSPRTSPFIRQ